MKSLNGYHMRFISEIYVYKTIICKCVGFFPLGSNKEDINHRFACDIVKS